jgi:predicted nucleic acid-binding protein
VIALDTNVVIDLSIGAAARAEAAQLALIHAASEDALVICGAVYAELCASPLVPRGELDGALRDSQIAVDEKLSRELWAKAGAAFGAHARRRTASGGSQARRILADFIIGAHALAAGGLVTSDGTFYKRAFPDLRVIDVRDYVP